ncbi:Pr6Pr family membrane protein [Promicromonospora sp. NPDC052451]|uniref:Pr6Pr family membrane protein n=1 Tax=Promicromonospora sp. NPDC052451 TaxID=3364407 RepID=UPI0037CB8E6E
MRTRDHTVMRLWYLLVAVTVAVGFGLQFYLLFTGGADANSGESGSDIPLGVRFVRLFSYFTVASNVLVLVVAVATAAGRVRDGLVWRVVRLDALLSIAVTGIVFSFVLAPGIVLRDEAVIATTLFHHVSPVLFVLGWLLWGPRAQWGLRSVLLAFVWPLAWLGYTFVRGAVTGWYPYPFLDVGQVGAGGALTGAGAVLACALVLTGLVLLVDRHVPALGAAPRG